MKCPVCRATYHPASRNRKPSGNEDNASLRASSPLCRRCGVDLSPLIHLHDQAIWHHRQAVQAFKAGDYPTAMSRNDQALALHFNHADFHILAGQLWALQGELGKAIAAWKKAQQLNPDHPMASALLQCLMEVANSQA
ncbi:tetratricopeptide repeat protein [Oculatella sp. LEGE 06141]|uniref:tetratricopeptide repeat protein n=1 Tax=Oculatella sp. LEGE 06141 TaxID=1828648 RepID=UPI001881972A|nr:tetratricopeptide repeat protein [Oculatella sp. LEGE 06141]MBE9181529.1 tetratricopeptide repeat protein [Oculatella sp. LEGE 06141]